ncbi:MAG: hypothetical protein IPI67_22415 [Myxococcales bacterium]|nr:hypothetical protein [Myxococcales bacterium]
MKPRGKRRSSFVPEIVFTTLCAVTVIPACGGSGSDGGKKDGGGMGGASVAAGGFAGVAAGGFGGFSVADSGFGGASVAAGGFAGMSVAAGGFGGASVAAGGFGGFQAVAAGGFGGLGVADSGFGGAPADASPDAMNDATDATPEFGTWAVSDAFSEMALPARRSRRSTRGRTRKRKRA